MGQYILSYDIGTSATKATLFSADGKLMGSAVEAYPTKLSNFSWAEQDPENWWQAVIKTTNTLMEGISKNDIAVVSLSGQMSGATFLDREGNTVRPTIIWLDNRSTEEVAFLESRMSPEEHFKKSGRVANAVRPMEKAMWVKRNQPEAYKKTYKILQSKDYIAYRLTDCFMTDYSDASSTYLMDRDKLKWSEELFDLAELDMEKFPELAPSTTVAGKVTGAAAKATGLAEGTPVVIGAGDVVAAAVGSKCVRAGQAHICIGSSAWVGVTMEEQFNDLRTYSALHAVPGYSVNICCLSAAGISYKWMKDEICRYETHASQAGNSSAYALINEQIMKNSAGSHGVMYLPFLMGDMCLDKNPLASGSFIGLKTETSRADMLRAVVEGVCLYLDLSLKLFHEHTQGMDGITLIGGAAKGDVWRSILCDVTGFGCRVPAHSEEATSLGAAVIGGVGAGLFPDFSVAEDFIALEEELVPSMENHKVYEKIEPVLQQAYHLLSPVYETLRSV